MSADGGASRDRSLQVIELEPAGGDGPKWRGRVPTYAVTTGERRVSERRVSASLVALNWVPHTRRSAHPAFCHPAFCAQGVLTPGVPRKMTRTGNAVDV